MARSRVELMGLEYEAERLVRQGVSRAEVSRMLGVHTQTLAQWALKGGWRKKDLDIEASVATTQRTIRNVAAAHDRRDLERDALEAQAAMYSAAFRLIAEKGAGAELISGLIAGLKDPPRLAAPEAAAPDPKLARSRRLGAAELEQASAADGAPADEAGEETPED